MVKYKCKLGGYMQFYLIIYIIILYLSGVLSLITSIFSWRRRPAFGALPLSILLGSSAVWAFLQAFVFSVQSMQGKIIIADLRYLGIDLIPLSFFALTYEHTKKNFYFTVKKVIPFLATSAIFFIILTTNAYHHFFYGSVTMNGPVLSLGNGTGFWLNMIYIYVFVIIGIVFLIKNLFNSPKSSRIQTVVILLSITLPFIINMIFNFNIISTGNVDITPLAFSFTGLLCFLGLFKFGLFDVIPIAKGELFENLKDPVLILDNNKIIAAINKQALNLFHMILGSKKSGDYIGKSVTDVFHQLTEFQSKLLYDGSIDEKILLKVDIETKYFYLSNNEIFNKKGKSKGTLIILRDITDLEIALLEAKASQKTAELANQAKSRFLANMSHEIRTPMNAIIGISDFLYSTNISQEEQKKNLKTLMNSASGLLGLLNDILDYSKIEAGKLELEKTEFNLREVLDEITDTFKIHAQNKCILLSKHFDEFPSEYFLGDPTRLKQIFSNLINNSLKFTDEGQIDIRAEVRTTFKNIVTFKFIVTDTGIGIPEEKIETLFESFKQLDNSTTRKYGGTGLGLSIIKSLVEIMG
jgi:signal transduction histidine kinase